MSAIPPFAVARACRESRRIFARVEGQYARCFGTWICWERDILCIGDRKGHLRNAEFLKTVDLAGGLGKVHHLAIHEAVWRETHVRHGDDFMRFKKCSPTGIIAQLGVEHLTIVSKAGFFRDRNEFWDGFDERQWLWNNDTELDDYLKQLDDQEGKTDDFGAGTLQRASEQTCEVAKLPLTSFTTDQHTANDHTENSGPRPRTDFTVDADQTFRISSQNETHILVEEESDDGEDADDESGTDISKSQSVILFRRESSVASYDVEDKWACDAPRREV
jgi:hypothetical protein